MEWQRRLTTLIGQVGLHQAPPSVVQSGPPPSQVFPITLNESSYALEPHALRFTSCYPRLIQ